MRRWWFHHAAIVLIAICTPTNYADEPVKTRILSPLTPYPPTPHLLSVALSTDGEVFAVPTRDQAIKVRQTGTGKEICVLKGHRESVDWLAFSPDGKMLASTTPESDEPTRLWDVTTGKKLASLEWRQGNAVTLVFSPDGKVLLAAGIAQGSPRVHSWSVSSGKTLRDFEITVWPRIITVTPDGKTLAIAGTDDRGRPQLRLFDEKSGKEVGVLETGWGGMSFSPDGKTLALAGPQVRTRIMPGLEEQWTSSERPESDNRPPAEGERNRHAIAAFVGVSLKQNKSRPYTLAFSPDGSILASGDVGDDPSVTLWDPKTGKLLRVLRGQMNGVLRVAFSADGTVLTAVHWDESVSRWDVKSGKWLNPGLEASQSHPKQAVGKEEQQLLTLLRERRESLRDGWEMLKRDYEYQSGTEGLGSGITHSFPKLDALASLLFSAELELCADRKERLDLYEGFLIPQRRIREHWAAALEEGSMTHVLARTNRMAAQRLFLLEKTEGNRTAAQTEEITKLARTRVDLLQEVFSALEKSFEKGRVTLDDLVEFSRPLTAAKLDLAEKAAERAGALEQHVKLMKDYVDVLEAKLKTGTANSLDVASAKASYLQAQCALMRERAGGKPTVEDKAKVKKILRDRCEALRDLISEQWVRFQAGKLNIFEVMPAYTQLLQAELDATENPSDQLKAVEKIVEELKGHEKQFKVRLHECREAEITLLRLRLQAKDVRK